MKLRNLATIYIFNGDEILLMYRTGSRVFTGSLWAGIGGHFENEELNDPTACVLRELSEETGLTKNDICDLQLKYITIRMATDEIRHQYIFFANLKSKDVSIQNSDEGQISWIKLDQMLDLKMSLTNHACLKHFLSTGKNDHHIYAGIATVVDNLPSINFCALKAYSTAY